MVDIYLGEHYDVLNREVGISDNKIGLSIDPIGREGALTKTKSPIRYRIVAVYKVDDMRRVEKMLHSILDSRRVLVNGFGMMMTTYKVTSLILCSRL